MNPEVSVILPFFNAETTLAKSIESVLKQTFVNFEFLLVDNDSSDTSYSIAQKYEQDDSRIKILREKAQGVANAMNRGLQNANGKYLARMDADDIAHPQKLEKQVQFLQKNTGTGLVGSEVEYIPHERNTAGFKRFVNWVNSFHSAEKIALNRFIEIPVVNPTILFRREIYDQLGGCVQGDFPEDYEMLLRYLGAGVQMAKLREPLLEWHDYSTRLTRNDGRYSTEAFFRTKAKYFCKWSEKHNPFHPELWIWGAGRKTRQRAKLLENEGLKIGGFIDIIETKNALHYQQIPAPGEIFIVSMVTNPGAGSKIKKFLVQKNYAEGKDFMMMG